MAYHRYKNSKIPNRHKAWWLVANTLLRKIASFDFLLSYTLDRSLHEYYMEQLKTKCFLFLLDE